MEIGLKPLNEQAIVITGASTGIGFETAQSAASHRTIKVGAMSNIDAAGLPLL